MSNNYTFVNRIARVTATDTAGGTVVFENERGYGLRIEFEVVRWSQSVNKGFNTAQIRIYNINDNTFGFLRKMGLKVRLEAGYDDLYGDIFVGNINSVIREKRAEDIITTLYCTTMGDSKSALQMLRYSIVSRSLSEVLKKIAKDNGFNINVPEFNINLNNYTIKDNFVDAINKLGQKYGFEWSLDNDILNIMSANSSTRKKHTINKQSGLLKPPIITEIGADVEMYLKPEISPLDLFELSSDFATYNLGSLEFMDRITGTNRANPLKRLDKDGRFVGVFKTINLRHIGSTHTNEWYTKLQGKVV